MPSKDKIEKIDFLIAVNDLLDAADHLRECMDALLATPLDVAPDEGRPPNLLRDDEVAHILTLTSRQVGRMAREGKLPSITLPNGDIAYVGDDIAEWIDQQRKAQDAKATSN